MNRIQRIGAAALVLVLATIQATWAAGNKAMTEAQQQYRRERAHCLSGQSHQDRATCLREAGAAYQEARRGALRNPAGATFSQNATGRCDAQPPADREACVLRILGAGSAEGSVEGGGIIRRSETTLP